MWNKQKRERFQQLRQHPNQLTEAEQLELASLGQELETAESNYLNGATEQLRQERELTEKQNRSLRDLVGRRMALVKRLDSVLAEARAERQAIASELASILAGGRDANTLE